MADLSEQIKLLVELQALDSRIFKLEEDLEAIPLRIREMEEHYQSKSANLKSLEDGVKALQLKRKDKEGELKAKEDSVKKFQSQMYQVKTNKEYTVFQEEIGRAKADGSIIEEDILKIFDEIDIENKKIVQEKDFLKKEESVLAEDKKKLGEETGRIKDEVAKLKVQRTELSTKVDKTILLKYERILTNKDRRAVVQVANGSCQGCFRVMPAQVLNEVRMQEVIVTCEYCARILYFEE